MDLLETITLPGLGIHNTKIRRLDVAGLFDDVLSNPAAFGFTNTSEPLFDGASIVGNPNEYVFMDPVHPTTKAHAIIADSAFALLSADEDGAQSLASNTILVPEPAAGVILALGSFVLLFVWHIRGRESSCEEHITKCDSGKLSSI